MDRAGRGKRSSGAATTPRTTQQRGDADGGRGVFLATVPIWVILLLAALVLVLGLAVGLGVGLSSSSSSARGGEATASPTSVPALWVQLGGKLVGSGGVEDPVAAATRGASVAISGDGTTAIVGGPNDNEEMGAAWVFVRSEGAASWSQQGNKLVGSGATGSNPFQGQSVALSENGNTALVGAMGDNDFVGAVWAFVRDPSAKTWSQQGNKFEAAGFTGVGTAFLGASVALSGDGNTAVVGGWGDNSRIGATWVFVRSGVTWSQQGTKLVGTGYAGSEIYQGGAVSVSADGNTFVVGGASDDDDTGAAWVFVRSGVTWTQQGGKLVGKGYNAASPSVFQGQSVDISADGNTVIVGGYGDANGVGAAWVFVRAPGGGTWTQQGAKLVGTGYSGERVFQGRSVSLSADGSVAAVGGDSNAAETGAVWMFRRSSGGSWSQVGEKLVGAGSVGNSNQGCAVQVSADGETVIVGGQHDAADVGAAWIFTLQSSPP